jgi:hypothetical protein
MTVIEFGSKDVKINFAISALFVFLIVSVAWGVSLYQNIITVRHDIEQSTALAETIQVKNAELKNQLYQITDSVGQEAFLQDSGLVADPSPRYVQTSAAVSYMSF